MTSNIRLGRALLGAALIIGISATLAWLEPLYISTEMSHRLLGAMLGAVVVVYANAIPKFLVGRARRNFSSAADQAARRFAGWSLVLGGIGYMLAWLFAPMGSAALIAGAILAGSLIAAIVRCLRIGSHRAG
jgi:hypothetical protein